MNAALPPPRRPHPPPPAPGDVVPGHALDWLAAGWRIFMRAPLVWALQALIFFVILAALGMVPFLGWAAAPVTLPVLVAGMLSGARALDRGEPLHVGQLFDGTATRPAAIWASVAMFVLSVIYLAFGISSFINARRARQA